MAKTKTQVFDLFYDILESSKDNPAFAFSFDLRMFNAVGIEPNTFLHNYFAMTSKDGFKRKIYYRGSKLILGFYKEGIPAEEALDCIEYLSNMTPEMDKVESCVKA